MKKISKATGRVQSSRPVEPTVIPKITVSVDIIIPCHNYSHFLADCLRSVANQTLQATTVIVVDDSSDDSEAVRVICKSFDVQYMRVEYRNVFLARKIGFESTTSKYVIFLDADDKLEPDYVEKCVTLAETDARIGVVTTEMREFGASSRVLSFYSDNIEQDNWIHAGSLARRLAFQVSDVFKQKQPVSNSHADWYMWRHIMRHGWRAQKISEPLYMYRKHDASMMLSAMKLPYYTRANLQNEDITVVLPLSGRGKYFKRLTDWVNRQERLTHILVIDSSTDPAFRSDVLNWLETMSMCHKMVSYISLPPSNGLADSDRTTVCGTAYRAVQHAMPRIYCHLKYVTTEYMLVVEDDVLPPDDVTTSLLQSMDRNVAAVSAQIPSRWQPTRDISWRRNLESINLADNTQGVEEVGGTGFGCLLLRRSVVLDAVPFNNGGWTQNYDVEFSMSVRTLGWRWLLDWRLNCQHG